MRFFAAAAAAAVGLVVTLEAGVASAQQINGAGATFPAPVYTRWGEQAKEAIGVQLNYQAIGSGGGVNQITNRTVDFGASDAPVAPDKLASANLVQFPTVMGAIVLTVNLPDVPNGTLKLTGPVVADIYRGEVERWNDDAIAELNPDVDLPSTRIAPVYRADASGTTYGFTTYLSTVSPSWKDGVGAATSVSWPVGVGARGNDGVAAGVNNTRGAIGYVEYAYAKLNNLNTTQLQNKDGNFVQPEIGNFQAAAAGADWTSDPNFAVSLFDQPGANAWPLVSPTYILVPTNPQNPQTQQNVLKFFNWALQNGDDTATELAYVPLPTEVADAVRKSWTEKLGWQPQDQ